MASSSPQSPTQGSSPPPDATALPSIPEGLNNRPSQESRKSSLGFLRRARSGEPLNNRRSSSGSRPSKKQRAAEQQEQLRREREAHAARRAPRLPDLPAPPQLKTFGGEDARPDSVAIVSNKLGGYHQNGAAYPRSMDGHLPHNVPIPPMPRSPANRRGEHADPYVDPYARTESMTNRGRYSYASSAVSSINSPRRVRRRKDPTPYNILVIGARNSGKTSFLNFLRTSLALPARKRQHDRPSEAPDYISPPNTRASNSAFTSHYLETEIDGERIGLTLWDSQGLEKNVVDLQLREISSFIESKFEDTLAEEMKVVRAPGVQDTHIHCVFLILDPVRLDGNNSGPQPHWNEQASKTGLGPRGGLDEAFDLQIMRALQGRTIVIPVISKADTITTAHMAYLKKTVAASLKQAKIDPLEAFGLDELEGNSDHERLDERDEDEENDLAVKAAALTTVDNFSDSSAEESSSADEKNGSTKRHAKKSSSSGSLKSNSNSNSGTDSPYFPLSIISPDIYDPDTVGRKFPWGIADPYDPEHCDFNRLKNAVFTDWRGELREASRDIWYEGWRTSRLRRRR
ncbi:MAG: hypothetical protein M1819_003679 [Sarea resinae]|nr:MAG: hypothetical protein M1819_003679 [Sarea resinae]